MKDTLKYFTRGIILFVLFITAVILFSSCNVFKDTMPKAAKRVAAHPEWYCGFCKEKDSSYTKVITIIKEKLVTSPADSCLYEYYVYCDSLNNVIMEQLSIKDGKIISIKTTLTDVLKKNDSLLYASKNLNNIIKKLTIEARTKEVIYKYRDTCQSKDTFNESIIVKTEIKKEPIRDGWFWFFCMFTCFTLLAIIVYIYFQVRNSLKLKSIIKTLTGK